MMAANATTNGVYVTGQLGYAKNKTGLSPIKPKTGTPVYNVNDKLSANSRNLAGRLAIGYQFSTNWAVEMGYLQLSNKKFDGLLYTPIKDSTSTSNINGSINISQSAIDLVGKGIYPINDKFNVYGKFGVAYLTTTVDGKHLTTAQTKMINNSQAAIAKHKWAPEAAVGVSYDITPNMFIDTSWTHIQPLGKNKPGNIDFVAVGLGYSFG
ncbi:outer membrane beta-barrel protein [Rickettsiella endosymbiont of Rhagonycha lignosa]|uniref:outer membrane beta-barrel protein n=1 Tax=Rickettsiella endosymbiont of Rhagonycha lignosa TaxID=3077937 RepID=UPI00313C67F2